ncbi:nucleoside phosphorylase [Aspergillus oryzae 3.042]|uniref:Nucleoside phosphorylase n=1 Tax=Aspergillus oryzae (strain 3.042) TaxID=1160506 RepID=I8TT20_ASPO3|nr:nucleoside phosphorylase [Aspergillus oryzae 3.042]|eukprot:EIT77228.1 nucleoside phosphorylase [Aspergillus oryzae 3.042]
MGTTKTPFSHNDYTVGWIRALPLEMAAAKAMLDEVHPKLLSSPSDHSTYTLGTIGCHSIVIICLPSGVYGTIPLAIVASQMISRFSSLRFSLMVGIGGGVPSRDADIRLGDVVVSNPTKGFRGVRTGTSNKPSQLLLTALNKHQANNLLNGCDLSKHISQLAIMTSSHTSEFTYQGQEEDQLFHPEYDHMAPRRSCEMNRPTRSSTEPRIHYGLIASCNQAMKDAKPRDRLARQLGIICLEMEAAGLVGHFPCLVIRGISDYAEFHKNDQWHGYAIATAAAYAKELLSIVLPVEVVGKDPADVRSTAASESKKIHTWLSSLNFLQTQQDLFRKRPQWTGTTLLSSELKGWINRSIIVDHLRREFNANNKVGVACVYCNSKGQARQTVDSILASLLLQLVVARGGPVDYEHTLPDVDEIHPSEEDLKSYAESRIKVDISRDSGGLSDQEKVHIVNTVVKGSDEIFLLVKLHMDTLRPTRRKDEFVTWMNGLPDNMDKALEDTVERLGGNKFCTGSLRRSRYLTVGELDGALALDDLCECLVDINQIYLEKKKQKGWLRDAPGIATTCLESFLTLGHTQELLETSDKLQCAIRVMSLSQYSLQRRKDVTKLKLDINAKDNHGTTALHWAVRNGHKAMVKLLVNNKNTDINAKDSYGRTALHWAARSANKDIMSLLLRRWLGRRAEVFREIHGLLRLIGAPIAALFYQYYRTPLSRAAERGDLALVTQLLDWPGTQPKQSTFIRTPLSLAAENGHGSVVKLLVERNADINFKFIGGRTPLSYAAENGHRDVVEVLLRSDTLDVDSKETDTLRIPQATDNGEPDLIVTLAESKLMTGRTPLSYAAEKGFKEVVEILLSSNKVDVSSKDGQGLTPLMYAERNVHEEVVAVLQG